MHKMLATLAAGPAFPNPVMPNVEVFRTNVASARQAFVVVSLVQAHFAGCRVTLDLDDCDRVLRVQAYYHNQTLPEETIRRLVSGLGFEIEALAD